MSTTEQALRETLRGFIKHHREGGRPYMNDLIERAEALLSLPAAEQPAAEPAGCADCLREVWTHSNRYNAEHGITRTPEMQRMYLRAQAVLRGEAP